MNMFQAINSAMQFILEKDKSASKLYYDYWSLDFNL